MALTATEKKNLATQLAKTSRNKLTEEQIEEMARQFASGEWTKDDLAAEYEVSKETVVHHLRRAAGEDISWSQPKKKAVKKRSKPRKAKPTEAEPAAE